MKLKKIILFAAALSIGFVSFGQKSKIREANRALDKAMEAKKESDAAAATAALKEAKAAIDEAVANSATADDAKAWLSKANIYFALQENNQLRASDPFEEGITALQKSFELNSKLRSDQETTPLLVKGGFFAFNEGVGLFNESKFKEAITSFNTALDLMGREKEQRFILYLSLDTVRAQTKMLLGFSNYYLDNYDEAITALSKLKDSPYLPNRPNIYVILSQAYGKKGDTDNQRKTLEEGKAKFPDNTQLSNAELNLYMESGNQEAMIQKLEEAMANDPQNASLPFNLGIIYDKMAHPASGNPPAKAEEYEQKAIMSYQKALNLAPNNATYNYQFGAFYFNRAVVLNEQLNELGLDEKEKSEQLAKERDAEFAKALPLLEKSKSIFAENEANLTSKEKSFYVQNLRALSKIYAIQNQLDKAKKIMNTLKSLKQ